ncbi:MAG: hypothetical protein ACR5K9_04500 [Wolbachia sp.]
MLKYTILWKLDLSIKYWDNKKGKHWDDKKRGYLDNTLLTLTMD